MGAEILCLFATETFVAFRKFHLAINNICLKLYG